MSKIIGITEVIGIELNRRGAMQGQNGSQRGFAGMLNAITGTGGYDGFIVETDEAKYHILIENGQ